MQKIALLGFGFMGAMHADVYRLLPNAQVVAVVDPRGEAAQKALQDARLEGVQIFTDWPTALAEGDFSIVDICLPTDLHRETALEAFTNGKHVFCEKPIALNLADAAAMTKSALHHDRQFMVGHCIRFWPEYQELQRIVNSGEHGRLLSLSLVRRTGRPAYSVGGWVNMADRCLGAALDLHIHDTDFLLHLLGSPEAVFSQGLLDETGWSSITTQYVYHDQIVTAEGAWNYPANWGFLMRFNAVFESAVLDFDSRATPTLMLTTGKESPHAVSAPRQTDVSSADAEKIISLGGYYHELDYFINCLERGEPIGISTGKQASESLNLVLTEIESARLRKLITLG